MKTKNYKKLTEQPDFERGHEILEQEVSHGARSGCSGTLLYFAYGSNMNLNQMAFRCPDAEVVDTVRLEGYRLTFRTNGGGMALPLSCRKKEAVWMASCGGSPNRMNSIWTITRDSPIYMGRNLSP